MKKVCSYRHSRSPHPVVHCNRKILAKQRVWEFYAAVHLEPVRGTLHRPVIEYRFTTEEPMTYADASSFAIIAVDDALKENPGYVDYEWSMSIHTEALTTTRQPSNI